MKFFSGLTQRLSTPTTGSDKLVERADATIPEYAGTTGDGRFPHFLRLPASIRLQIYHYVLGGLCVRVCDAKSCKRSHRCRSRARKTKCPTYFHLPRRHLTLLATCRQIHSEAGLLPFALNEFYGEHWDMHLTIYYRLTDAQVSAIADMRIYVRDLDVYSKHSFKNALPVVKLGSHLISTLQALSHLRGLRRLALEWVSRHSGGQDWLMIKRQILELATKELERLRGTCTIEVFVVSCNRYDEL